MRRLIDHQHPATAERCHMHAHTHTHTHTGRLGPLSSTCSYNGALPYVSPEMSPRTGKNKNKSSKVLYIATLYSKYTRALTCENFRGFSPELCPPTVAGLSPPMSPLLSPRSPGFFLDLTHFYCFFLNLIHFYLFVMIVIFPPPMPPVLSPRTRGFSKVSALVYAV